MWLGQYIQWHLPDRLDEVEGELQTSTGGFEQVKSKKSLATVSQACDEGRSQPGVPGIAEHSRSRIAHCHCMLLGYRRNRQRRKHAVAHILLQSDDVLELLFCIMQRDKRKSDFVRNVSGPLCVRIFHS